MFFLPVILLCLIIIFFKFKFDMNWLSLSLFIFLSVSLTFAVAAIDIHCQTMDTEVWSGKVLETYHKEEWEEWIPPKYETRKIKNSKGKVIGTNRVLVRPGHYKHHNAINKIKTSDNGWISVYEIKGKKLNDSWPNTTEELNKLWPIGSPSASVHSYVNKVQASYSIYRHDQINPEMYSDLPEYPQKINNYIDIDRIIGYVPNKQEALKLLAKENTRLNKMVVDPENPKKQKSWKQVNIIFVNVGEDKLEEYGFALQDKWENGNKNDFIISFSMNKNGKLNWVYPFSWSEVEILKLNVIDYMMDDVGTITDFNKVINNVSKMVEKDFIRKQFADFNYLQVELSKGSYITTWIINIILLIAFIVLNKRDF